MYNNFFYVKIVLWNAVCQYVYYFLNTPFFSFRFFKRFQIFHKDVHSNKDVHRLQWITIIEINLNKFQYLLSLHSNHIWLILEIKSSYWKLNKQHIEKMQLKLSLTNFLFGLKIDSMYSITQQNLNALSVLLHLHADTSTFFL